jgi:hypothetical protein
MTLGQQHPISHRLLKGVTRGTATNAPWYEFTHNGATRKVNDEQLLVLDAYLRTYEQGVALSRWMQDSKVAV